MAIFKKKTKKLCMMKNNKKLYFTKMNNITYCYFKLYINKKKNRNYALSRCKS